MDREERKERLRRPRPEAPARPPGERTRDFAEIVQGLPLELARREAERCLGCAHATCTHGCPLGVKIREFVELIRRGDYLGAAAKIREDNVLPSVTGRVCPYEQQCEGACVLGKRFEPVAIGYLERFVADYEHAAGRPASPERAPSSGRKVAVVGSGPAGLAAAADLVRAGHAVTVLEAHAEVGGLLVEGIPEFRLPREVVEREVANLRAMGIEFRTGVAVGETVTVDTLLRDGGYDAVLIAIGANRPRRLGIPGEDARGVMPAGELLARARLLGAHLFPGQERTVPDARGKRVLVIGGGDTACDAARTAVRLGAGSTRIVYRRSERQMPARPDEVRFAREEGVELVPLTAPVEFLVDDAGCLRALRCARMELGAPDASGRARPVPVAGSDFDLPADLAVVAVGTTVDPRLAAATPGLENAEDGSLRADAETCRTSREGVFAAGDAVTGMATVARAMAGGRRAARAIDRYLRECV